MEKSTQIRFEKFLKDFGCEERFKRNLDYTYATYIKNINATSAISVGFSWYNSPEGSSYWDYINRLWKENYEKSQELECWIARDGDGLLYLYNEKPNKGNFENSPKKVKLIIEE